MNINEKVSFKYEVDFFALSAADSTNELFAMVFETPTAVRPGRSTHAKKVKLGKLAFMNTVPGGGGGGGGGDFEFTANMSSIFATPTQVVNAASPNLNINFTPATFSKSVLLSNPVTGLPEWQVLGDENVKEELGIMSTNHAAYYIRNEDILRWDTGLELLTVSDIIAFPDDNTPKAISAETLTSWLESTSLTGDYLPLTGTETGTEMSGTYSAANNMQFKYTAGAQNAFSVMGFIDAVSPDITASTTGTFARLGVVSSTTTDYNRAHFFARPRQAEMVAYNANQDVAGIRVETTSANINRAVILAGTSFFGSEKDMSTDALFGDMSFTQKSYVDKKRPRVIRLTEDTVLSTEHENKILLVDSAITLTIPAGLAGTFLQCFIYVKSTGNLTMSLRTGVSVVGHASLVLGPLERCSLIKESQDNSSNIYLFA